MKFSKKDIISHSWKITKNNFPTLFGSTAMYLFLIMILFQIFSRMLPEFAENIMAEDSLALLNISLPSFQNMIFLFASILFITGLNLGFLQICINIIKEKEASYLLLFKSFDILGTYIIATILYIIIQIIVAIPGVLFCLVVIKLNISSALYFIAGLCIFFPVVYFSTKLQFYIYFLIDKNQNAFQSLINSYNMTNGYVYQIFIIGAILQLIVQISIIPLFIGLIVALPFSKIVLTNLYFRLSDKV